MNIVKLKLNKDNEGVSPVVGVILMVAITVVLAAVVFILVQNLGNNSNHNASHMALNTGDHTPTTYKFTVVSVDNNIKYSDVAVKVNGSLGNYTHTGGTVITAGDVLTVTNLLPLTHYDIAFIYQGEILASESVNT